MTKDNIIGVIYALPKEVVERILSKDRIIFIKYMPKARNKKSKIRLNEGNKLYFYVSKNNKILAGESIISKVEFYNKEELIKKYPSDLMLTKSELNRYTKGREEKSLLTLELIKIKKYISPIILSKPVNMGGLYITEDNENILRGY